LRPWPRRIVVASLIVVLAVVVAAVVVIWTLARNFEHMDPGVRVVNRTSQELRIEWLRPDGTTEPRGSVDPRSAEDTYVPCTFDLVAKTSEGVVIARREGSPECKPWVIERLGGG